MIVQLPVTIQRQPDYTTCGRLLVGAQYYNVTVHRLIGAIFLGAASDDSNLLVIRPRTSRGSLG